MPVVVKAACQGSSIGVEIVKDEDKLEDAITEAFSYRDNILIEEFELSVPVIGNDNLIILPIIEIISEGKIYDFKSKYTPGMSHHIIPARISEKVSELVKKIRTRISCSWMQWNF